MTCRVTSSFETGRFSNRFMNEHLLLSVSFVSRLLTVALMFLNGFTASEFDTSTAAWFANESKFTALKSLVSWDAVYFLFIAENGYFAEQQFAFFPGYPLMIRVVARLISFVSIDGLVLCGVFVSNLFFILATRALYRYQLDDLLGWVV